MSRDECLKKFDELTTIWIAMQLKLESHIQKWLDGDTNLSEAALEQLINTTTVQIEELKARANAMLVLYKNTCAQEVIQDYDFFGNEDVINDETLQYGKEENKQTKLIKIRRKVAVKQISLNEALILKQKIDNSEGYIK